MPRRNPFNKNNSREKVKGKKIINVEKTTNIHLNEQELEMEKHSSKPDKDGNYNDTLDIHLRTDNAGTILPKDREKWIAISQSGVVITSPDELGECTSRLHPNNRTRFIRLGIDGQETDNGARCSYCESLMINLYIIAAVLGSGIILGIFKGAGF